jgi:uncharacterized membrane protein YgcG
MTNGTYLKVCRGCGCHFGGIRRACPSCNKFQDLEDDRQDMQIRARRANEQAQGPGRRASKPYRSDFSSAANVTYDLMGKIFREADNFTEETDNGFMGGGGESGGGGSSSDWSDSASSGSTDNDSSSSGEW